MKYVLGLIRTILYSGADLSWNVFRKFHMSGPGIQINRIFNIDIDIANFEKSILILILILLGQYIARAIYC